jgi:hypothetical protein
VLVTVRVPVRGLSKKWRLFEVAAVPFAWKGQTCVIESPPTMLAVSGSETTAVVGGALRQCQPHVDSLCLLP